MNFRLLCFALLVTIASGCNDSDHFGFARLKDSIHYKLIVIGDESLPVSEAKYISLKINLKNDSGLVAHKTYKRVNIEEALFPVFITTLIADANMGDSIQIIGSVKDLKLDSIFSNSISAPAQLAYLEMTVSEVFTDSSLRQQMAIERMLRDAELHEKRDLTKVLDSLEMDDSHYIHGVYLKALSDAGGRKPSRGDVVYASYVLRLANGRELANTSFTEPFEYHVGKPDQAITGFAIGVYEMSEGGTYHLVIPSQFGFGARGSSSGLVPPFSILIYEVRLEHVGV